MENLKNLKFKVHGQRLKRSGPIWDYYIVQGSVNFLALEFEFDDDWNNVPAAVNFNNGADYEPIDASGVCIIPADVLAGSSITFSVEGATGSTTVTTNTITLNYEEGQ